jgi:hypothetical protein
MSAGFSNQLLLVGEDNEVLDIGRVRNSDELRLDRHIAGATHLEPSIVSF